MNRPRPPCARPADYRRPAWRPGRFAVSAPPWCDNEHPLPGHRTAEPSDGPAGVTLCTHGGGAFACPDGLPRPITNRHGWTWPTASVVEPAASVLESAPPLASLWRSQHAVKGQALDRALGRPPFLASVAERRFGTGRDYQLQSEPIICPLAVTADTKARITTGRRRLAFASPVLIGTVIVPLSIRGVCAGDASFLSPASPPIFRISILANPSAASWEDTSEANADSCDVPVLTSAGLVGSLPLAEPCWRGLVCRPHFNIVRSPRPRPWSNSRLLYLPLRRSPHCGGRSTPSRDALLSQFYGGLH